MDKSKRITLEQTISSSPEFPIMEKSELGQVMDTMDSEEALERNTRVTRDERANLLVLKELKNMGILPQGVGLVESFMRTSISLDGKGREEKVRMVQGEREQKQDGGFMRKFFGQRPPPTGGQ